MPNDLHDHLKTAKAVVISIYGALYLIMAIWLIVRGAQEDWVARKAAAAKRIAEQFGVLDQKVNPYPCYRCRGPITGKGPNSRFCTECGIAVRNERRAEHERRYRAEAKAARQVSA